MTGIDEIFQREQNRRDEYKDKARMYQDILIFGSTIPENQEFKLWDLARYLLHNNEELHDRYYKSELRLKKLTETNKIENVMQRVKRNIENLVDMRLMAKAGEVREERGTGLIPTYTYTRFGYVFSQIIQSLRSDVNVEAKIYALFQERLLKVQPNRAQSFFIFTSNWIKKINEKGQFGRYVSILKKVIDSKSIRNIREFTLLLQNTVNLRFFQNPLDARLFVNTWVETINELEPEVRKLYLLEEKLSLDVKMGAKSFTLEYEKLRLSLIGDVEVIALEGYCNECKQLQAIQIKIVEYYGSLAHVSLGITSCPACNGPHQTLQLPQLWR